MGVLNPFETSARGAAVERQCLHFALERQGGIRSCQEFVMHTRASYEDIVITYV